MNESDAIISKDIILDNNKQYKIGIITDIHGNDVAFKKALELLSDCDFLINLGDFPGIGPNSNEVYEIYKETKETKTFYSVLGNHERYLLFGFKNPLSCLTFEQQDFTEKSISKDNIKMIEDFPLEYNLVWNNQKLTFLHYGRRVYNGVRFKLIEHNATLENMNKIFDLHDSDYIFYGHEHIGSILEGEINGKMRHFINPGSCGCPCPNKGELRCGVLYLGSDIKYEQINYLYDASSVVRSMIDKKMPNKELIIHDFYKEDINNY